MITALTRRVRRRDERSGLVITLAPEGVYIAPSHGPGCRSPLGPVPVKRIYLLAAYLAADAARQAKRAQRKTRRPRRLQ